MKYDDCNTTVNSIVARYGISGDGQHRITEFVARSELLVYANNTNSV